MSGLGQALRWLREKQARKQYRVADNAGITKGMLSAYETGRQRPALETLEKILETLGCDLNDLHNALQIVNGRPEHIKSWRGWQTAGLLELDPAASPGAPGPPAVNEICEAPPRPYGSSPQQEEPAAPAPPQAGWSGDLDSVLGRDRPRLPVEEEAALNQMMDGFHSLVRYWHRSLSGLSRRPAADGSTRSDRSARSTRSDDPGRRG